MPTYELTCPLTAVREDARALRAVTPAYAGREGELTSVLQYVYQSVLLGARGEERLARALGGIAADEIRHLQLLGSLITRLGAPPLFTACPPYPVSYYSASCVNYARSPREMLEADIACERASAKLYDGALASLTGEAADLVFRLREEECAHLHLLGELSAEWEEKDPNIG